MTEQAGDDSVATGAEDGGYVGRISHDLPGEHRSEGRGYGLVKSSDFTPWHRGTNFQQGTPSDVMLIVQMDTYLPQPSSK